MAGWLVRAPCVVARHRDGGLLHVVSVVEQRQLHQHRGNGGGGGGPKGRHFELQRYQINIKLYKYKRNQLDGTFGCSAES